MSEQQWFTIREYVETDLEHLIELVRHNLEAYTTRYICPWEDSEKMLRRLIPASSSNINVAEADDKIVGFLWVDVQQDYLFVEELHVIESKRQCGLGLALFEEAEKLAREHSKCEVRLSVFNDLPAVGFYERLGFSIIGETIERNQRHLSKDVSKT